MTTPQATTETVSLREIAYSRSGDKGDIINVSVIAYDAKHWDVIREQVTVDVVRDLYGTLVTGDIIRYELPGTHALNFVMHGALGGGISTSLRVDGHGKSLQSHVLQARVTLP